MFSVKIVVPLLFGVPSFLFASGAASSVSLTSSPNPAVFGQPVTLVAVVTPTSASGKVTFYDGTAVLGAAALTGGSASLTTTLLACCRRTLKAYYAGDAGDAPSTSTAVAQTINTVPGGEFGAVAVESSGLGLEPVAVAVADFNGDGRADLVISNSFVSVLLGNGDGSFQTAVNYGSGVGGVVVGDFNGDGKADMALVTGGRLSVLLGNGDGTFLAAVTSSVNGYSFGALVVGDFNGDGVADLVSVETFAPYNVFNYQATVFFGNGDGTFRPGVSSVSSAGYPESVAIGDFNGDGKADVAVVSSSGNVAVYLGNGDGTFQPPVGYPAGTAPKSIAVGDFNGDGVADLAIANSGGNWNIGNNGKGSVSVLLGLGDGTFRPAVTYGAGSIPYAIAIGDFNGDGTQDLVTSNRDANVSVFFGNGDGTFRPPENYASAGFPFSVALGDFNGDGRADLVTVNVDGTDADVLLALAPAPDLSVTITHAGNTQGQTVVTYTLTVSNVGYAPTSGTVTVTDSLPSGFVSTNVTSPGWTCEFSTPTVGTQRLTCTRADELAGFASYPAITITANVAAATPGGVTNSASVSGGGQTNIANDSGSDFTSTFTSSQVAQAWSPVTHPAGLNNANASLLMTDGTVLVHQDCTGDWYRLTPDASGNYSNGTWSQTASMPAGYGPSDFSSAVLADGRLVVIGGEYNERCSSGPVETNLGAIYDPVKDMWTSLSPPATLAAIGDAENTVLPSGQFLLGSYGLAMLDPATLTWTNLGLAGKIDETYSEEGWTLLPDGTVLTVDVLGSQSERYFASTNLWEPSGPTVAQLSGSLEMGPQVLRPNGTVFAAGATGHSGVYDTAAGAWTAGPDFPTSDAQQLINDDGPAVLLPSGNVLVVAFASQEFFFEFDGAHLNPVPTSPSGGCNVLLLLPTGQALCPDGANIEIYNPTGSPNPAWAPTIAGAPGTVQPGLTYPITGTQFNGLSQAVAYGDDYQGATNYPLVRMTNTATGHVFYCRTHNHSTMGVATGSMPVSTQFDVPASIEMGPSTLVVVANGIPSQPWSLTVAAAQSTSDPTIQSVEGSGLSAPPVTAVSPNGFFTVFGSNLAPAGTSRQLDSSDIVNGSLPTNLAATCVNVGNASAFLTYVSPTQINAIVPALTGSPTAPVSAVTNCGASNQVASNSINAPLASATPEFLYWTHEANGQNPVVAVAFPAGYIGPPGLIPGLTFRSATAGDTLTIYGIGFGATKTGPVPGLIPPTADSVPPDYTVTIGGVAAIAVYVGVTPTNAGLYQVNLVVPSGITPGNQPIILNVNGASTPASGVVSIGP